MWIRKYYTFSQINVSEQQLKMRILKICQQIRLNLSIQPLLHTYPIQGSLLAAVGKQL